MTSHDQNILSAISSAFGSLQIENDERHILKALFSEGGPLSLEELTIRTKITNPRAVIGDLNHRIARFGVRIETVSSDSGPGEKVHLVTGASLWNKSLQRDAS